MTLEELQMLRNLLARVAMTTVESRERFAPGVNPSRFLQHLGAKAAIQAAEE